MINGETFKGLSSFASVKDLSRGGGFISFAGNRRGGQKRRNREYRVSTSDGRDFRWRGGGTGEDEQRQDRKRRNDIDVALVRQREDRLLFFHAVVSPPGASEIPSALAAAAIENLHLRSISRGDQSAGRVPDLPNGHYYTGNKTMCASTSCYRSSILPRRSTRKISARFPLRGIGSRRFDLARFIKFRLLIKVVI